MDEKLSGVIKELIGARSLSEVQKATGIPKATTSRLLNGNYAGRPSVKVLWKLTEMDKTPQCLVSFETVMRVAGYTEAETEQHRRILSATSAELIESERRIIGVIRDRLSTKVSGFKETVRIIGSGVRCVSFELRGTELLQWTFILPSEWSGKEAEAERLAGLCALMPRTQKSKVSILYPSDTLRRFAFNTSMRGNISVILMTVTGEIVEEFYLCMVEGETQILL